MISVNCFFWLSTNFFTSIGMDNTECSNHHHHHNHVHNAAVTSVTIVSEGTLDIYEVINYYFVVCVELHLLQESNLMPITILPLQCRCLLAFSSANSYQGSESFELFLIYYPLGILSLGVYINTWMPVLQTYISTYHIGRNSMKVFYAGFFF